MTRILRARQSREDYAAIFEYIADSSPENAERVLRLFDEKLMLLADSPNIGRPRPELAASLRTWNVHRFVLYYSPTANGIELIRVLHGSMDIENGLFL